MAKAAFIGLGVMGYPMAGHLQKNGHDVTSITAPPQKPKNGRRNTAATAPIPRRKRRRARILSFRASATTTTYARWFSAMTAF